ncbi:patatin-like phospholipase family protein [Nostoc sp. FACHB-152]|uniref:patatin-like phospholipase family protein n=1 Tax=unclassified Nostoc TaxID=2593658 RepID=UPI00168A0312|nr:MULTISPECIES: patatin-like phospholipase family protein [unclassified Nostoc]MBD2451745.1 patatin-like phospholipase family protein [Nostoc sp. FACHB-152]MBD2472332.1 patatin-like phospholipase family protein [Nostoc sp. FACHB-145]
MSFVDKANKKTGPYKLLALDGGGIRGVITLEVLAKIEATLRDALGGDQNFVLADYFDYIAGTSTGAIIATALSLGMSVAKIQEFYQEAGKRMFDKAFIFEITRMALYKYGDKNLADQLKQVFGESTTFGSERLKTLLMLVMRNANTDSPWPLSNNPKAKFNNSNRPDSNLNLPLWQLVRASTAAPTFFPPETVQLGDKKFVFVDGGVTPYNNPAFQLFLMATLEPYQLMWPAGEDNMLLVSIGTGITPNINPELKAANMHTLYNAQTLPMALMLAAQYEQDFLCRIFGKCLLGDTIDQEVGDLLKTKGPLESKLFTYLRYNVELTREGLNKLGGLDDIKVKDVQQMDSVEHMGELKLIGKAIAKTVQPQHFSNFLHSSDSLTTVS